MTESEIQYLHSLIELNNNKTYLKRYDTLPLELNTKKWKWEGKGLARVISLLEFKRYMEMYNLTFEKILSFNGDGDPEFQYLPRKESSRICNFNYEDDPIHNDLHTLNLEQRDYDFCMLNSTLEHLYDPDLAIRNIYKHLRSNAVIWVETPCIGILHNLPLHFALGFTPIGLASIIHRAGFKVLEVGQWGNRKYINAVLKQGWLDYKYTSVQPGKNEFDYPTSTWVLAIKE